MASKQRRSAVKGPHARKVMSQAVRAAGIVTTATAGALMMSLAAPHAIADSGSSELQPTIDQILANMQQAVAYDEALPNATEKATRCCLRVCRTWNTCSSWNCSRSKAEGSPFINNVPEMVAGDAADSREYMGAFNPDNFPYTLVDLDPNAIYTVTGTVGAGTRRSQLQRL